jgi:hypothetical protein
LSAQQRAKLILRPKNGATTIRLTTLSTTTLSITIKMRHSTSKTFMLSVAFFFFLCCLVFFIAAMNVIKLNVILLTVVAPNKHFASIVSLFLFFKARRFVGATPFCQRDISPIQQKTYNAFLGYPATDRLLSLPNLSSAINIILAPGTVL